MRQKDRMNSATNAWEADPWDASDAVADDQLAGFQQRASKPIRWTSVHASGPLVFGLQVQKLIGADVECHAEHDGEDLLLMRLVWHGFPDPPEWRLASRRSNSDDPAWTSWGYFAEIPKAWKMPDRIKT